MISDKKLGKDIIQLYEKYRQDKAIYKKNIVKDTKGSKSEFLVNEKYEMLQILGKGSYGVVCSAINQQNKGKDNQVVAIKKIQKPFEHKILTKRMIRELHLLKLLKHQNIIRLQTILMPYSRQQFDHVYCVFEFMDTDLHVILQSEQQLQQQHFRFFLYQTVRALKYLHSAGIVHRDLKPRNLLVNANCDLKLCDFGLARSIMHRSKTDDLTDYVATRWYRAPQLLLGCYQYTAAVDMWSVGCIFAQMIQRKAFLKGKSSRQQIQMIAQVIGIQGLQNVKSISQGGKRLLTKLSHGKGKGKLRQIFKNSDELQLDLLTKFLAINPQKRITAVEALRHPYFQELHIEADEPQLEPFPACDFQFELYNLNTQQLKDILYEQILTYNYPQFSKQYEQKRRKNKSLISHIIDNSNKDNKDPDADLSQEQKDDLQ